MLHSLRSAPLQPSVRCDAIIHSGSVGWILTSLIVNAGSSGMYLPPRSSVAQCCLPTPRKKSCARDEPSDVSGGRRASIAALRAAAAAAAHFIRVRRRHVERQDARLLVVARFLHLPILPLPRPALVLAAIDKVFAAPHIDRLQQARAPHHEQPHLRAGTRASAGHTFLSDPTH